MVLKQMFLYLPIFIGYLVIMIWTLFQCLLKLYKNCRILCILSQYQNYATVSGFHQPVTYHFILCSLVSFTVVSCDVYQNTNSSIHRTHIYAFKLNTWFMIPLWCIVNTFILYTWLSCVFAALSESSSRGGMSGGHSFTQEMLENENDHLVSALSDKVAALKSVSVMCGNMTITVEPLWAGNHWGSVLWNKGILYSGV